MPCTCLQRMQNEFPNDNAEVLYSHFACVFDQHCIASALRIQAPSQFGHILAAFREEMLLHIPDDYV